MSYIACASAEAVRAVSLFFCLTLTRPSPAQAAPIEVQGVRLDAAARSQAIGDLGLEAIDPSTAIVAFDLAGAVRALGRDPSVFTIEDDGLPVQGPSGSGGPFTGVDVDAVVGKSADGSRICAVEVVEVEWGPPIAHCCADANGNCLAQQDPACFPLCIDSQLSGLFGADKPSFPRNVLGCPDAIVKSDCAIANLSGFASLGSGGKLGLRFAQGLADWNQNGPDLFLFDAGGSGDNAVFSVAIADCNSNGVEDTTEIASGASLDRNDDGKPDECETIVELVQSGPLCVTVVVANHVAIKAGELGICYDPLVVTAPVVQRGPDFPPGDGQVILHSEPPGACCGQEAPAGFVIGWTNSQTRLVPLPPGRHRLLEICFRPAPSAQVGSCSPLVFRECLGDPNAPVGNVVTTESDASIPASPIDGHICVQESGFRRGDANDDGRFDISDPVAILSCLFFDVGKCPDCRDAADANDDGRVDISDSVYLLLWRFAGGASPPAPFPGCGLDPTQDSLDCRTWPRSCFEEKLERAPAAS